MTKKIFKAMLILLGIVLSLYGLLVVAIVGYGHWFNLSFIALGLALLAAGIFIDYILKINKYVLMALGLVLCLCLCNFAVFECRAVSMCYGQGVNAAETDAQSAPDWIIVLGAKVDSNGSPKLEFAVRLNKAEEICTADSNLILTGGKGNDEPVSEADGAFAYLSGRSKISAAEILLENKSTSTSENLVNALEIIKANGGSPDDSVLIISSSFHLYRASKLAEKAGYTNASYAGATGLPILEPFYFTREYAAYMKEEVL